ncbi:MAG: thiamine pyrophosphate-binding protein [Lachnospiraceae bacterium]|nr:thiamine pyrophosphate-binding protein [Lachnospiraceae bacterium]
MIKLSEYVFKFLKSKGVNTIFMLPGGGAMHLVDSLGTSGIEYIHCQHEQAAAVMAESYGQHSNHIGVALVTSGPGATNTITGVAAGWIDSTPMLIISGQAKRCDLIGDKGVRQVGSQEVTITEIVKPIVKYVAQVYEPETIRYHIEKAYYEATTGRKGPVWLDIPMDVQAAMLDEESLKGFDIPEDEDTVNYGEIASEIIDAVKKSENPIILAGNGIYSSGASEAFTRMLERVAIPVQTTWKAVDLMCEDDPLYVGHPGGLGDRGANFAIQKCDLLLSLGARIDNSVTAFNEECFSPASYKIVVDIDINELNKFTMHIDKKYCCDVNRLIEAINDASFDKIERTKWISYCKKIHDKYFKVDLSNYEKKANYVDGYYFTKQLSNVLEEGDIIVPESSGVTAEVTIQAFENKKRQKLKHAAGLGSMGFGLPYSIAACLANDKKRTVLVDGDGAFQLNIQELETLHRLNLPIKIFIWDNNGYASIRNMQRNNFNSRYVGSDETSGLTLPDIADVASAYKLPTAVINNDDEVVSGIEKVLSMSGPVVCIVKINTDQVVAPKVQARIGENGKMIPGQLDYMWPFDAIDEEDKK